jgi:DNA replication licensing factor MCM6
MAVRGEGLLEEDGEGTSSAAMSVVYVLHPNCAVEDV